MLSQVSGNGASEKKWKAFSRENNVTTREYQREIRENKPSYCIMGAFYRTCANKLRNFYDSSQLGLLRQVMLDLFTIFSKGGIVLWCFQGTCQSFTLPVNELIRSVILQVGFQGYDMIWWVYLRVSFLNHLKAFKSLLIPPLFVITGTRRK